MEADIFLDTAYALALASATDQYHGRALQLAEELQKSSARLVTTQAVLLEIGNSLAKLRYRSSAVRLLSSLVQDPQIEIVWLTQELQQKSFQLFQSRIDKEWGLIDCMSFVVMQDRGIREALTSDVHFEQAGFQALLLRT